MKYVIGIMIGAMLTLTGVANASVEDEVWFPLISVINQLTTQITNLENEKAHIEGQLATCQALTPSFVRQEPPAPVQPRQEVQAPSTPVYNTEEPSKQPSGNEPIMTDTTKPQVDLLSIDYLEARNAPPVDNGAPAGFYLRITTNEPVSVSGIEVEEVIRANHSDGITKWKRTNNPSFYTEVRVAEPQGNSVQITLTDNAGNEIVRNANVVR